MRKILTAAMATAVAAAMAAGASASTTTKHKKTGHTLSGTIGSYDAASHTLTVKTGKGEESFALAADAKVWAGSKSVAVDELASNAGKKATVTYAESAGQKTAKSVRIAPATTKPSSSKPATK